MGATPPTVFLLILSKIHWCFGHGLKYACGLDIILRLVFVTFSQVELIHISSITYNKGNGQGIPCGRNSSYSFYRFFQTFTGVSVIV